VPSFGARMEASDAVSPVAVYPANASGTRVVRRQEVSTASGAAGGTFAVEVDARVDQLLTAPQGGAPAARRRRQRTFRKDIEGLRAVAILAVVLYHAHVGVFSGGYVGVDVFFVISGYLITDHLFREVSERGTVSFSGFYSRRIRRLLPASFLVLAVTALATAALLPPLTARANLKDGVACALYVGNYRFALLQTNYLTASAAPSPFQQYWSLGVEEQFYLLWPAVLVGATMVWRARRARASRGAATAVLAVIAVTSFAFSVWLTNASQPWAFFSLPTRAWELAVGGLVALGAPAIGRWRGRFALGWLGLVAVAWSILAFTPSTPFPGTSALVPVLGAAAIIAAGCGPRVRTGAARVLSTSPMQAIGRVSYSWYLWHWPMLILAPAVVGHTLSLPQNLAVATLSLLVAVATFVMLERPVRSSRWFTSDNRRGLRLGAGLSGAAIAACVLAAFSLPSLAGTGHAPVASAAVRAATKSAAVATAASKSGSAAANLELEQEVRQTLAINQQVARSLGENEVPANLEPSLPDADADEPPVFVDGCLDSYTDASLQPCVFGDAYSPTTVVLFGDSHAAMWFPALDAAADKFGWRLITWTKATCPPFPLPIISPVLGRTFTECDEWQQNVLDQIQAIHPALVVLGVARHYTSIYGFTPYSPVWLSGMGKEVTAIRSTGAQVMVIGPVPKPPFDVPGCLSAHLTTASACTVPTAVGLNSNGIAAEQAVVTANGGTYLDTRSWFCTATTCATMVDNLTVYRDDNHITQTHASFLAPAVEPALQRALSGLPPTTEAGRRRA
jgi:peptidoglycan/LPS O-acetylase OafA/YrhL